MHYLIYTRVSPRGSDWTGETSCQSQDSNCRADLLRRDPGATFDAAPPEEFKTGRNNARPVHGVAADGKATAQEIRSGCFVKEEALSCHPKGVITHDA